MGLCWSQNNNSSNSMYGGSVEELNQLEGGCNLFSFENQKHICKVVKCYDGDTVHCIFKHDGTYQKFKIRMLGYNSPEIRTRDAEEKKKGYAAKARITELLLDKVVYLECGEFDKYGRILGTIRLNEADNKTVNQMMIDEGYGVPYNP